MKDSLKKTLGPLAYRALALLLPIAAGAMGALLLAYDTNAFNAFCGQT